MMARRTPTNAVLATSSAGKRLDTIIEAEWSDGAPEVIAQAGQVLEKKQKERHGIDLREPDIPFNIGVFDPEDGEFGAMSAEPRIIIMDVTKLTPVERENYLATLDADDIPYIANEGEVRRQGAKKQRMPNRSTTGILAKTAELARQMHILRPDFKEVQEHKDIVAAGEAIQHYIDVEKALRKTFSDSPDYIQAKEWMENHLTEVKTYLASKDWLVENADLVQEEAETCGKVGDAIRRDTYINGVIVDATQSNEYLTLMNKHVDRHEKTGKIITSERTAEWQGRSQPAKKDSLIIEYPEGSVFYFVETKKNGKPYTQKRVRTPPSKECDRRKREFMDKSIRDAVERDYPDEVPAWLLPALKGYPYRTAPPAGVSSTSITVWSNEMREGDYKTGKAMNKLISDIYDDAKAWVIKRGDAFKQGIVWITSGGES